MLVKKKACVHVYMRGEHVDLFIALLFWLICTYVYICAMLLRDFAAGPVSFCTLFFFVLCGSTIYFTSARHNIHFTCSFSLPHIFLFIYWLDALWFFGLRNISLLHNFLCIALIKIYMRFHTIYNSVYYINSRVDAWQMREILQNSATQRLITIGRVMPTN